MSSAMKLPREMPPAQFAVKIGPQELGQIITLRKNLDHMGVLARFAEQYRKLGWLLTALDAATGVDLSLDFTRPRKTWAKALMDVSLEGREVNLAVALNANSRLFAVKLQPGKGSLLLDRLGPWRSTCVASAGSGWEQHFFLRPLHWRLSSLAWPQAEDPEIVVLGEGRAALIPPALEPHSDDTWRWLKAPWETPPCPPPAGLCRFLKKQALITPASQIPELNLSSWEELFTRISHHQPILRALLAPPTSPARYYQEIIKEALKAGFSEPETLQSLIWHAPHGEARRHPERWLQLVKAVGEMIRKGPGLCAIPETRVSCIRPGVTLPAASAQPDTPALNAVDQETRSRRSLLEHLDRLTARTLELERQLAALRKTSKAEEVALQSQVLDGIPGWEDWLALIQRPSLEERERREFRTAVANFLSDNPDLAGDEGKIFMVHYCYNNYVKINPAFSGLPYQERMAKAGEITRSFLKSPAS